MSKKGLSADQIKLIAVAAMTIDHLTWVFFPGTQAIRYVVALQIIGRLTAPVMSFFIAEGCHYTRSMGNYIGRLFLFAVISHFSYDFAFGIAFVPLSTGIYQLFSDTNNYSDYDLPASKTKTDPSGFRCGT